MCWHVCFENHRDSNVGLFTLILNWPSETKRTRDHLKLRPPSLDVDFFKRSQDGHIHQPFSLLCPLNDDM